MNTEAGLPGALTEGDRRFMTRGLCNGENGDDWFPNYEHDPEPGEPAYEAQKMCDKCPVKSDCLTYAMENRVDYGIWGGLTETQRKRLRRVGRPDKLRTGRKRIRSLSVA